LLPRVVVRLRALVLLPTRDLAVQVKRVFDLLSHKLNIKVSLKENFVAAV
jgi:superfamily II DNA/RNA helicase